MDIIYVDMGTGPDTGTGDTWYNAFIKVNHNFLELETYLNDFGFVDLADTPDTLVSHSIPFVNVAGDELQLRTFGSDSDLDPGLSDSIQFDYTTDPGKIILSAVLPTESTVGNDNINMHQYSILNVADITEQTVTDYNSSNTTDFTIDDLVINKRFADLSYHKRSNPVFLDDSNMPEFSLHITSYLNGNAVSSGHGLDNSYNGTAMTFSANSNMPTMLSDSNVYYIRVVDSNQIALYTDEELAITQNQTLADSTKIVLSGTAVGSSHYLTFEQYDNTLSGDYLLNQAVPRSDLVLKIGDEMSGALVLHDHPAPYTGTDFSTNSRMAATKLYVDNMIETSTSQIGTMDRSIVDLQANDLLIASGYYRAVVSNFDTTKWNVGNDFGVTGETKNCILHDIKDLDDSTDYIITYSLAGDQLEPEDQITNGVDTAIVSKYYDEICQTSVSPTSHITALITRTDSAEYNNIGPVAYTDILIKDDVITNDMISATADIEQSKLLLNDSTTFLESDPSSGWSSTTEYKRSINGSSSFSNANFDSNNGFVRIKNHGIAYNELQQVPDNTVLGSHSNLGVIQAISFEDIITYGGGLSESNLDVTVFNKFDTTVFEYTNDTLSIKPNSLSLDLLNNINSGFVLGRKTTGFGQVELVPISDFENGGLSSDDLSDSFDMYNDELILADNGIELSKLEEIPAHTVLGNDWSITGSVKTIPLSQTENTESVVMRKSTGQISCSELQLDNNKILKPTTDTLMAYVPTGQLIFASLCSDACDFNHTETTFNGRVNALNFTETSDKKFKTNITTITDAIDTIRQLRGVDFDWVSTNQHNIGLIAQEVEQVLPCIVHTDSNGDKSISYTSLIGLLVQGFNEIDQTHSFSIQECYDIGTVVVVGEHDISTTNQKNDPTVIGVVNSCNHGQVVLYSHGKAKCKVLGKVKRGDRLVSSAIPGYAIVDNSSTAECIIGKSLTDKNDDQKSIIDIWI